MKQSAHIFTSNPPTSDEMQDVCERHVGNAFHDVVFMLNATRSAFSARKVWKTTAELKERDASENEAWLKREQRRFEEREAELQEEERLKAILCEQLNAIARESMQVVIDSLTPAGHPAVLYAKTAARESTIPSLWQQRTPATTAATPITQRRNQRRY